MNIQCVVYVEFRQHYTEQQAKKHTCRNQTSWQDAHINIVFKHYIQFHENTAWNIGVANRQTVWNLYTPKNFCVKYSMRQRRVRSFVKRSTRKRNIILYLQVISTKIMPLDLKKLVNCKFLSKMAYKQLSIYSF